jgi:hypothetical protein
MIPTVPTPADEATEPMAEPAAAAPAAASTGETAAAEEDEDPFPPALIVGLRAPDRAVARIIGPLTSERARLGTAVTFGISAAGRHAERAAVGGVTENPVRPNVLSLPTPRISPFPTRVATTSFDGDDGSGEG